LIPRFGSLSMSAVNEKRVQEFIADLTRTEHVLFGHTASPAMPRRGSDLGNETRQTIYYKA